MNKVALSVAIGIGAGLAIWGAYAATPYVGVHLTPMAIMVIAAGLAFGSSAALLAFFVLDKQEPKKVKPWRRISHLATDEYRYFPTTGVRLVLHPDTEIKELDIFRNTNSYATKDVVLVIKKSKKATFNPVVLRDLFAKLSGLERFEHILMINEHDEYIGYIPALYARMRWRDRESETAITKYIVSVLENPEDNGGVLREIDGLGVAALISDRELISDALSKLADSMFRGFVVYRGRRNRKLIGVIYEQALVTANLKYKD
jgi:hypothetical protein